MSTLLSDIRYAIRSFAKNPGFTAVVIMTLGLGIGSNVAIFSVADAVLFEPLPYEDPEELVLVWNRLPATNVDRALVSGPDFLDYREQTRLFEGFSGAFALSGALTGEGPAEEVMTAWVSDNLFDVVGVTPLLGRAFTPEDGAPIDFSAFTDPNAEIPPGPVIISHGLWRRRFGSDPTVIGRGVQMDGAASVIAGVLPPDFRIYLPADAGMPTDIHAWRPIPGNFAEAARDAQWLTVVARLKDGVTPQQAQQEMDAIAARLREDHQYHATANTQIVVKSMHNDVVEHARPVLLALLGTVGFVLLIACANVANLLLVRAASRDREIAVRAALGGGRGRIIQQMLTESGVLGAAGSALGLLLAWWGIRLLVALRPEDLPRLENVAIDGTVLLFTGGITVFAALLFGSVPAVRAASSNLADSLKERGSDSGGVKGNKLRTALVVSEVGLSLVLLIGAGLMLRSFSNLQRIEPGFDAESVLTFSVPIPFFKYPRMAMRSDFINRFGDRVSLLAGTEAVGAISPLPLAGGDQYSVGSYGREGATDQEYLSQKADYRPVFPGYLDAMRIALISGRTFIRSDNEAEALPVVIIDQRLAELAFPGEEALGKQLTIDGWNEDSFGLERRETTIIGVVDDVQSESLTSSGRETVYIPVRLQPWLPMTFTVRAAGMPTGLTQAIRAELEAIDADVPMTDVMPMTSYVTQAMAQTRFILTLIGIFAALALILASVGLYGVIAYSVRQRTREIGVRMAFGAGERTILRLVLRQGMQLAGAGVLAGLIAAFFMTGFVASMVVGVSQRDPVTFIGIPGVLLVVSLIASYLPAKRATRVDPVFALRDE